MRIGVGLTTRDRRPLFLDTLNHWLAHLPADATLVVVDDASAEPLPDLGPRVNVIRHPYRLGVAMSKNRCIAELMDAECDELFLADDDVYPLVDDWWTPYIESSEPHLSHQWPRPRPAGNPWSVTHDDGEHFALGFPRGVMLYCTRKVIDTVGGMDPAYGIWGGEHVDFSRRIHRAGLTRWEYADVCGSDRLWFAHDKNGNRTNSTVDLQERRRLSKANGDALWDKPRRAPFVPYRIGEGEQDYSLGNRIGEHPDLDLLRHVVGLAPEGVALEFGVWQGKTLRIIADRMPVIGFDSFTGLPEDWRAEFKAGMFALDEVPDVPGAAIVVGLFEDVLPTYPLPERVGLVHFDADLYSSTKTALEWVQPALQPGTFVVFDEYHGYEGCENHEAKAWREFADRTGITWTVIGHGREQWAIRIV